jgi:hypothetical protein
MPNPYLTAALRAQDPQRPKRTPNTSASKTPAKKAAESASTSDNPPSKEN